MAQKKFKLYITPERWLRGTKQNDNTIPKNCDFFKVKPELSKEIKTFISISNFRSSMILKKTKINFQNKITSIAPNQNTIVIKFYPQIYTKELDEQLKKLYNYYQEIKDNFNRLKNFGQSNITGRKWESGKNRAAAIYIISKLDKKILVHKRGNNLANPETISVPGGLIDPDESALKAVLRELKEETGIILDESRVKYLNSTGKTDIYFALIEKNLSDVSKLHKNNITSYKTELQEWPKDLKKDAIGKGDIKNNWISYDDIINLKRIKYPEQQVIQGGVNVTSQAHPSLYCWDSGEPRKKLSIILLRKAGII